MRRPAALLAGLLVTAPAALAGAPLAPRDAAGQGFPDAAPPWDAADPPASGPGAAGGARYVVGFHAAPRDLQAGDLWHGARVLRVNHVLHHAAVHAAAPALFEAGARSDANLRYLQEDPERNLLGLVPDDPRWADQYGPQQVRAPQAWDTALGSVDAKVCVVDTGVRYTHHDLEGARWLGGTDVYNNDDDPWDDHGHGTHVAGTAAAGVDNGIAIAGLGNVGLYGVKALGATGSGTWTQIADGIQWCADNAGPRAVISLSLGGAGGNAALEDAVRYAWGQGALLVAAAGNDGPCSDCVNYPAAYPDVIAVTCTDGQEAQCSFSSDGPESELAGPGDDILSLGHASDAATATMSGTSMSTPHVSGVAALVWSQATELTNQGLRDLLGDHARDVGAAGWDERFGHGIVDAEATLDAALGAPPPPAEERVLFEDFDDGAADGWTLGGLWHVSGACATAPSGARYLGYNQDADCEYSTGGRTTGSAAFDVDLTGATVATLSFQHRWETESYAGGAYDILRVQASGDGGATWTTLRQWDSRDANQLAWGPFSLDLDAYAGAAVDLRFSFDSVDGVSNAYEGWFLDDVEVTADLGATPQPNQPPVADAGPDQRAADDDGSGDEAVTLDGRGSSDPDGTIQDYAWTEGGATLAAGATPTVTLATGTHTLTLTVTDDDGATATDTVVVTVDPNQAPAASFTAACDGLACDVDGAASSDPDGAIASWAWDFGDGGTGAGSAASHAYAAAGTYTITLTVTDNGGLAGTATRNVTVEAPAGPTLVYEMTFDDGADGWHRSGDADLWHLGGGCLGTASGATSLQFNQGDPDCSYATGARETGWARSPVIDLSGHAAATLEFQHAWDTESYAGGAYDVMKVQASGDGGATWTTLRQWDSRDANQPDFREVSFDVSAHATAEFRVRFHFDTVDRYTNDHQGWHVDDVRVYGE